MKTFGVEQKNAVEQMVEVMRDDRAVEGALMADHHLGYSMPIGGVVSYDGAISPTGVGFDIGCGNKAVRTNLNASDLGLDLDASKRLIIAATLMRQVKKRISFGLGRTNATPIDHPVFDAAAWGWLNEVAPGLKDKAHQQLGTVGSGNHYVDLLLDDDGALWVANHFGSRGLGHTICSGFIALHAGRQFTDRTREPEGAVVFDVDSEIGAHYIECMKLAGSYAHAGRDYVIEQVLGVLGAEAEFEVHNHHNYAWEENGRWVVRKGATPLNAGPAFVGGSMGGPSAIITAVLDDDSGPVDVGNLGSAPHGAGRVMSRTQAAGKMRKMWFCNNRNCDLPPFASTGPDTEHPRNCCPRCELPLHKRRLRDTSTAAINWTAVRQDLHARGIAVLGGGADEAPGVYKDLTEVLAAHPNIAVVHTLLPVGVVMAGPDERDPYKD